jgi:23S rRNA pseudouridine2605 synthase
VAVIGQRVDPGSARVTIDGLPLPIRPDVATYLVYKPVGVISTADDPQGRPTVVDLVESDTRLYPVGRLDAESEGLMLLTNDGELANLVMHPSHGILKTYVARVSGIPPTAALGELVRGVELDDGEARAVSARLTSSAGDQALVEIVMAEGRKREVRRMFEAIGHEVVGLVRTRIGPIGDQHLAPGAARRLSIDEIRSLYSAASVTWEDASLPEDDE